MSDFDKETIFAAARSIARCTTSYDLAEDLVRERLERWTTVVTLHQEIGRLKEDLAEVRQIWLPCDQTLQCALCGWTGWTEKEGPHSWECPIGYMDAQHAATVARLTDELVREREARQHLFECEFARWKARALTAEAALAGRRP